MEAYQKSVQDVDIALRRLNATLESYRIADAKASSTNARTVASTTSSTDQESTQQCSTKALNSPSNLSGNSTSTLREREQQNHDEIWQEVLDLRCQPFAVNESAAIEAISKGNLQNVLSIIERIQKDFLSEHPHLIPLRLILAKHYLRLGYPDLAAGEAYKALLLCDAVQDTSDEYHSNASSQLRELIQQIPLVERISLLKGELIGDRQSLYRAPDEDMDVEIEIWVREHYLLWTYRLLILGLARCGCYKSARYFIVQATANSHYSRDVWLLGCLAELSQLVAEQDRQSADGSDVVVPLDPEQWPDSGHVRREVYPWNTLEPDRLQELPDLNALMAKVAPKLEIRAVELPALADAAGGKTIVQLGVFAKEDIKPGETVLDEPSMLTANNKLQDALCDACSVDLPDLDASGSTAVECSDCEVVFCSQDCYARAEEAYHPAVCGADLDALLRDVPPAEAANSLYALLLLRAMAMAETQECHPLEVDAVKYIWGDFHGLALAEHFRPPSCDWRQLSVSSAAHGGLPRTLPFSFEHNIKLPLQMLEKMDIDPFANQQYDLWVLNTLYAKFRGTASARLSGLSGRAIRGPEVSAVHPMWCMANHSCDPNVSWEWGGSIKFWTREKGVDWHGEHGERKAGRSPGIKKDEEVLNHYCDIDLPVQERREWARGALGGDCMCARCRWEAK